MVQIISMAQMLPEASAVHRLKRCRPVLRQLIPVGKTTQATELKLDSPKTPSSISACCSSMYRIRIVEMIGGMGPGKAEIKRMLADCPALSVHLPHSSEHRQLQGCLSPPLSRCFLCFLSLAITVATAHSLAKRLITHCDLSALPLFSV